MSITYKFKYLLFISMAVGVVSCGEERTQFGGEVAVNPVKAQDPLRPYQSLAARFNSVVSLPTFERTPEEILASTEATLNRADQDLSRIAGQAKATATFESLIVAIDDSLYEVAKLANRLNLISETSTDKAVREMASEQLTRVAQWSTSVDYRQDLFEAVKSFRASNPQLAQSRPGLSGEHLKFYEDLWRDYQRAGLTLDAETQKSVESLRKQIDENQTAFSRNQSEDVTAVRFTTEELEGVPDYALAAMRKEGDSYWVKARIASAAMPVLQYAKRESTRERMLTARYQVGMEKNVDLFEKTVSLRQQVAKKLGYKSWGDYRVETKMAQTAERAEGLVALIAKNLAPKMSEEIDQMLVLKRRDTGNAQAEFKIWDYYYYMRQLGEEKFQVDYASLREFFSAEQVLKGMFEVYSKVLGVQFKEVNPPYKWVDDLRLIVVQDSRSQEPLGFIYFDLYPRDGKYGHFAQFGIIDGKRLPDGRYQRPVVALVCNFPAATQDEPSLWGFEEVETMFHEFGHALHSVLTRAELVRYSGTSVQADFVEAPSQMLENWLSQPEVIGYVAKHYKDPSKVLTAEMLEQVNRARTATKGIYYRRQMALAASDIRFHRSGDVIDSAKILQDTFSEFFLPLPANTNFVADWGHMMGGYDMGYYGYAWADVISSDLFTAFASNPNGYLDPTLGMRMRKEIYEVGGSRPAAVSIEAFLGRAYNTKAFFESFGLTDPLSVTP